MSYDVMTRYSTKLAPPVGPGIDISHYGAPFKGMLGLGEYVDRPGFHAEEAAAGLGAYTEMPGFDYEYATAGMGAYTELPGFKDKYKYATAGMGATGEMLYRYQGMGSIPTWSGAPAADPRMLKRYSRIRLTYAVSNVASSQSARAADLVLGAVRSKFSGNTVRKVGNGWISGGRIAIEVILAQPMRLGLVKSNSKGVERDNPLSALGGSARLRDARTSFNSSDIMTEAEAAANSAGQPTQQSSSTPPANVGEPSSDEEFEFPWLYAGLGAGALLLLGGAAYVVRRKKKVTPNRRRRRRRTSRRR
jgi:hypothetical protein